MKHHGFHLIEVLVVCAILGILLSIAIPGYTTYIRDAKRVEAKIMLLKYAFALERYSFLQNSYQGATAELLHLPSETRDKQYQIVMNALSDYQYELRAAPQSAQFKRDVECRTLTLNQAGERGITGKGTVEKCWR